MITHRKIEQLKKTVREGTRGPWLPELKDDKWTGAFITQAGVWYCRGENANLEPDYTHLANAHLVATAVTELPSLISEIERLNKELFKSNARYEAQCIENRRILNAS